MQDLRIMERVRNDQGASIGLMSPKLGDSVDMLTHQVDINYTDIEGTRNGKAGNEDNATVVTSPSPNVSISLDTKGSLVLPPSSNVVSIVDDAIIRGRDKYLDAILAARNNPDGGEDGKDDDMSAEINRSPATVQLKLSVPTRTSSVKSPHVVPHRGSSRNSPIGSLRGSPRPNRSPRRSSPQSPPATERSMGIDALLDGTKEVLWPVFATYCSCGDSMEPGKLSGPNLFALLSKLNVLTEETALSDIGVLLHQVSSHTTAQAPTSSLFVDFDDENGLDSPLLSFEEFLVFLCAFSHLRYEGTSVLPDFSAAAVGPTSPGGDLGNISVDSVSSMLELHGPTGETWLECWYHGKLISIHSLSFKFYLYDPLLLFTDY